MRLSLLIFLIGISIFQVSYSQEYFLITGTYTAQKSEGIYVFKFNTQTVDYNPVSSIRSSNPSFLALSPNQTMLYAVNENADSINAIGGGTISSYHFDKGSGQLHFINQQLSGGNHPCFISTDQSGRWLFAGNYSSGTIGLLPIKPDGSLDSLRQIIKHTGSGPNSKRQSAAHVHATRMMANNYLYVPDLGIDQVRIYHFNKKKGQLSFTSAAQSNPGSGPRHIDFSSDQHFAYLMEEMSGTVTCYKIKRGQLSFQQRIDALPAGFQGVRGGADIHVSPNGKFLYCSNRGESNSISIFSIHPQNGQLKLIGNQSTLGKTPRNFSISPDGQLLLVANQQSDEIVIFKIDAETGLLSFTGKKITVPNPVCLVWVKVP